MGVSNIVSLTAGNKKKCNDFLTKFGQNRLIQNGTRGDIHKDS